MMCKGRVITLADSSSLLHGKHSSLPGFRTVVDAALGRAEVGLSNAASTSAWKPHSEWRVLVIESQLASARRMSRPLLLTPSRAAYTRPQVAGCLRVLTTYYLLLPTYYLLLIAYYLLLTTYYLLLTPFR